MPKRHNLFQDLILSIHQQLAPPYSVTESDMLRDARTGQLREVDIVIRSVVSGYNLIISIECTNKSRPATVEWVEQICSKHKDLPTQKLVLVSKSGFTETAVSKAVIMGAEAVSLEDAKQVDWTKYVGRYSKLFFDSINAVSIVVPVSSTLLPSNFRDGVPMKTKVLDPDGKFRATAEEILNAALSKKQIFNVTLGKMDKSSGGGWEILLGMKQGVRISLPDKSEYEINGLKIVVIANPLIVSFDMEQASFRDTQVAYGASQTKYGEFLLTILEKEKGVPSSQIRIRRPWGEVQTYNLDKDVEEEYRQASDENMRALIDGIQNLDVFYKPPS
jgi:hypothetical protein